ncbi:MAG: hypothetical protein ACOWWR_17575 [Eubacteriales bacterium]
MWFILILFGIFIYYMIENKKNIGLHSDNSIEILKKRYINGEIDEDTYLKMKKVINNKGGKNNDVW